MILIEKKTEKIYKIHEKDYFNKKKRTYINLKYFFHKTNFSKRVKSSIKNEQK